MREAIVAVFDTAPHSEEAVRALQAAGIESAAIRRYRKGDPQAPRAASERRAVAEEPHRSSGGFWSWLTGNETTVDVEETGYRHDYPAYTRAVESGNMMLAVTVESQQAPRVMDVLESQSPLSLEDTGPAERTAGTTVAPAQTAAARRPAASTTDAGEQRIPLAEEELEVGKRRVEQGTTRIHRYVVERPVEQQVNLQDERVEIERRRPVDSAGSDAHAFEERTVEVREFHEEPVVSKRATVPEEVVVRTDTSEHPETVRGSVRKEEVEVEKPKRR